MKPTAAIASLLTALISAYYAGPASADFGCGGGGQGFNNPNSGGCGSSSIGGMNMDLPPMDLDHSFSSQQQARPRHQVNVEQQRLKTQSMIQNAQAVSIMQGQMQEVASYMSQWCMRNSRFPEQSGEWQQRRDVERQINMLVSTNPYARGKTIQAAGMPQVSNMGEPGVYHTGAPSAYQYSEAQIYNESNQRVKLYRDDSLTPDMIDYWVDNPPGDWEADPGSIVCIGNNNGLLMVWGAGADGKPIKNFNGNTLIVSSSWGVNEQDMNSPNEDQ